ncbi:hypothetical protein NDU88_009582 [Pleurodeles waltl]|uniref:Uncharacterized protein n=1 Tax=Pleurodeles waltl TaxID=8319 RepID=A0AAV7RZF4_PLEWA|nr:hypothetical protein NDU88_009582 [Pleurodeles waltl]
MANTRAAQKDSSIKEMFTKLSGKKADRTVKERQVTATLVATLEVDAPVTGAFLKNRFTTLRDDIAILKQQLAADVKDTGRNVSDLDHSQLPEWVYNSRDEDMEEHRREMVQDMH